MRLHRLIFGKHGKYRGGRPKEAGNIPPDAMMTHLASDLLDTYQGRINEINELSGVSRTNFQAYYTPVVEAFARIVQLLPASEAHHHSGPGGMLEHGLEVAVTALKRRRSYLLPAGADAEEIKENKDLWTLLT